VPKVKRPVAEPTAPAPSDVLTAIRNDPHPSHRDAWWAWKEAVCSCSTYQCLMAAADLYRDKANNGGRQSESAVELKEIRKAWSQCVTRVRQATAHHEITPEEAAQPTSVGERDEEPQPDETAPAVEAPSDPVPTVAERGAIAAGRTAQSKARSNQGKRPSVGR
jgi:hypothetical protein